MAPLWAQVRWQSKGGEGMRNIHKHAKVILREAATVRPRDKALLDALSGDAWEWATRQLEGRHGHGATQRAAVEVEAGDVEARGPGVR